eukprot:8029340-Alexandrium_andersonii.AAC.1
MLAAAAHGHPAHTPEATAPVRAYLCHRACSQCPRASPKEVCVRAFGKDRVASVPHADDLAAADVGVAILLRGVRRGNRCRRLSIGSTA